MIQHPLDKCGQCERIPRSQIKLADYNPRTLSADQKRRLRKVLEKHGLCQPLTWNKRTGILVGGHQRITVLDSISPEKEWAVPVTVLDVDEAQERELNIALNNSDAAGDFDIGKLGALFKSDVKIDIESTGFDLVKLKTIVPDIAVSIPEVAATLAINKQHWQDEKKKSQERQDAAYDRVSTRAAEFTPNTAAVEKPVDRHEENIYETDDLFYIPFVFPDYAVATRVKLLMGLPPESRDQDGRLLLQILQEWQEMKSVSGKIHATSE